MTAESLKPFLSNTIQQGLGGQRRTSIAHIAAYYCLITLSAIGVISIVGLEIWNINRTNTLQSDLRSLQTAVSGLKEKYGFDLYDEIEAFGQIYDQNEKSIEGSGDDYYDDEDSSYEAETDDVNETLEKNRLHRTARSVRSMHGIPIVDESYAVSRERTHTQADSIVNNILLNKPVTIRPTMRYDWGDREKRNNERYEWNANELLPVTSNVRTRGSRVMNTNPEDKSQAFRQVITKGEYSRWQEEFGGQQRNIDHSKNVHKNNVSPNMHKSLQNKDNRVKTVAVHYGAEPMDTGDRSVGNVDWKASKWVNNLAMNRFFKLENGSVTVRKSGLYQVYAQITFENQSSTNGFIVVHNAQRFLECQTSTLSSNSCYTSRVVYLQSGDQIHLSDMFAHQSVVLTEGQSFFGLMKLGQVQQY